MGNKVADYNTRYSEEGTNDENYTPVTLTVILGDESKREELTLNGTIYLFTSTSYTQSSTSNTLTDRITTALGITDIVGSEDAASDIAKSISSIVLSDTQLSYNLNSLGMTYEESYRSALNTYNSLTEGWKYMVGDAQYRDADSKIYYYKTVEKAYNAMVDAIYNNTKILQYYEYYQFKKCEFECTGVTYDSVSNRVSTITFEFTGNIE